MRYDTRLSYAKVASINKTCPKINPKPVPLTKNRKKVLNIVPKPVPRVTKKYHNISQSCIPTTKKLNHQSTSSTISPLSLNCPFGINSTSNRFTPLSSLCYDSQKNDTLNLSVSTPNTAQLTIRPTASHSCTSNKKRTKRYGKLGPPTKHNFIPKNNKLTLCFWNGQSITGKTQELKDFRLSNDIDIYLLAETWFSEHNHNKAITELKDNTCNFINFPRPFSDRGGGLGTLFKQQLSLTRLPPTMVFTSMQVLELALTIFSKTYFFIVIYRSESAPYHRYTMSTFFKEFSELLAHYNHKNNEVIITGDFNIHVNKPNNPDTSKFLNILDTFNLVQHIQEPTHEHGNTLDLLITRRETKMSNFTISSQLSSDHNNILFTLDVNKPSPLKKTITNRKIRGINKESFINDIGQALIFSSAPEASLEYLNDLVVQYNTTSDILDSHAPLTSKTITVRDQTPWTSDEIRPLKAERRRLERKWLKTKLQVDYDNYKTQKNKVNTFLKTKHQEHISKLINRSKGNSKSLFKGFNSIINGRSETPFPQGKSDKILADEFSKYFSDKINNIRAKLDENPNDMHYNEPSTFNGHYLDEFSPLSTDDVKKLIDDSNSKYCDLDPIPPDLLKSAINEALPIITEIINTSLSLGIMPDILKHAKIRPLLKKLDLELISKNYRPVSNLSFLSKLIEGAVINQYISHLERNNIEDHHQSAYKKLHSTETLLTKVKNDILMKMDNGQVVMLVLLDLSAAFDTIDHKILLKRLENRYGIRGIALKWFKSYLTGRTQSVCINGHESEKRPLNYGVPQGSKLGPILFNSYIAPLSELVRKHGIEDEKFADDEELIMAFSTDTWAEQELSRNKMVACINDIRKFLKENKLCNNEDKTELLIIGTHQQLAKLKIDSISVGDTIVKKVPYVRNLGVILDENLTMEKHVKKICKTGYYHLRNIASIRKNIDKKSTEQLVHAFISSTLDYGNALLYGTAQIHLNKLQVLQNSAARLIEKLRKFDHISETLMNLHWLPIKARIDFKILLLTWKALNNRTPKYITNMLTNRDEVRTLRRPIGKYLKIPKFNRTTLGGNAYSIAAPTLWNQLPISLRMTESETTFRRELKTLLFRKYYNT